MEHKEDVDITLDVSLTYPLDEDYLTNDKVVQTYGHRHERLTQTGRNENNRYTICATCAVCKIVLVVVYTFPQFLILFFVFVLSSSRKTALTNMKHEDLVEKVLQLEDGMNLLFTKVTELENQVRNTILINNNNDHNPFLYDPKIIDAASVDEDDQKTDTSKTDHENGINTVNIKRGGNDIDTELESVMEKMNMDLDLDVECSDTFTDDSGRVDALDSKEQKLEINTTQAATKQDRDRENGMNHVLSATTTVNNNGDWENGVYTGAGTYGKSQYFLNLETFNSNKKEFIKLDKNNNGVLNYNQALAFFEKTNINREIITQLWKLIVTEHNDPILSKNGLSQIQFHCMYKIILTMEQYDIKNCPVKIPPALRFDVLRMLGQPANVSDCKVQVKVNKEQAESDLDFDGIENKGKMIALDKLSGLTDDDHDEEEVVYDIEEKMEIMVTHMDTNTNDGKKEKNEDMYLNFEQKEDAELAIGVDKCRKVSFFLSLSLVCFL